MNTKMIRILGLILTMCLVLNACDSLMGTAMDIKSLAQIQKENNEEGRKREFKITKKENKQLEKKLKYTDAEAQQLYAENQKLRADLSSAHEGIGFFFFTTLIAVAYIIFDKCATSRSPAIPHGSLAPYYNYSR